jgi:hypothetical protein
MGRKLVLAIATLAMALGFSLGAPASSHAVIYCLDGITYPCGPEPTTVCTWHTDTPTYKGWATISRHQCGGIRTMDLQIFTAWRWNATTRSWARTTLNENTRVYAWPFATGWSWVWTQSTGWLAIQSQYVLVSQTTTYGGCGGGTGYRPDVCLL